MVEQGNKVSLDPKEILVSQVHQEHRVNVVLLALRVFEV